MRMHGKKLAIIALIFLFLLSSTIVFAQGAMEVMIHSVSAEPVPGEVAYTVNVYLSVLESGGVPVQGLSVSDFSLTEDSQSISIDSVSPVMDEATNIVLVMDTSGSMSGQGIIDARNAAATFTQRLGANDQVAVFSFNDKISQIANFTKDHTAASESVRQINAVNKAGTCLYDAAYQAVELASTTPAGRRAVIVFTDGKDETNTGEICSFHIMQDVIDLAENTGTPVYALAMGNKIEENELKRLAANTGGSFLLSQNSSELDDLFSKLYEQLNNEYVLTYTSTNAPGPHSMTVSLVYQNQQDQSTYNFTLPALPTTISLTSPAEGEVLSGTVNLIAKILTQGAEVASVEFAMDGEVIGKDISEPYEVDWTVDKELSGETQLEVVAIGKDGAELARTGMTVYLNEKESSSEQAAGADNSEKGTNGDGISILDNKNLPYFIGGAVLLIAIIIVVVVVLKRKNNTEEDIEVFTLRSDDSGDKTFDGFSLPNQQVASVLAELGYLTVVTSDDEASVMHQYNISSLPTIMGRSAKEADIVFSGKEQAISRKHAVLEKSDTGITIRDLNSTYGTFVNGVQVDSNGMNIKNGDEIRLGPRTKLKFTQYDSSGEESATIDGIALDLDEDRTMDSI